MPPSGYTVHGYGVMLADRVRTAAYVEALQKAIWPGCVVADIGTGTGYFAVLACRLGARKVYGIEPSAVIDLARQVASQNGASERIEFIQRPSTEIVLPERADVIVSDLRSILPLFENHIPSIVDARERLLAPGGTLIARRDTMWAALIEAQSLYDLQVVPSAMLPFDVDMRLARTMAANACRKVRVQPEWLLGDPQVWVTLDYRTITDPNCEGEIAFESLRAGTAHGFALWFEAELHDDVALSNRPGAPELIYAQQFFSFEEPVAVAPGMKIAIALRALLANGDYLWSWNTTVVDAAGKTVTTFRQNTLRSGLGSPQQLRNRAETFVPTLDGEGEVDAFALRLMDGRRTLREIAQELRRQFPDRIADEQKSLDRAAELSARYAKAPAATRARAHESE